MAKKTLNANELLAKAILLTVREREASWTQDKGYGLTMYEAARRATSNKDRAEIVVILLLGAWNDAIAWAQEIEEKPAQGPVSTNQMLNRGGA